MTSESYTDEDLRYYVLHEQERRACALLSALNLGDKLKTQEASS